MNFTDPEYRSAVGELVRDVFHFGLKSWEEMFEIESTVLGGGARLLRCQMELVCRMVGKGALMRTKLEGFHTAPIHFAFPPGILGTAVGRALMLPTGDETELDPEVEIQVEAVQELMNLFCGSATQALQDYSHLELRLSQSVNDLCVDVGGVRRMRLHEDRPLLCIHVDVQTGERKSRTWCLLDPEGATTLSAAYAMRK
ncbi:MAG: hypothetical protein ACYS26_02115 [Planctomycetota bacterium]|jgi:hypothetical protein